MRIQFSPLNGSRRIWIATVVLILLSCTIAAYASGLRGPFLLDDYPNIVDNEGIRLTSLSPQALLEASAAGVSGLLGRPLSVLSFAGNYYFSGLSAFGFKLVNLCIHLANGILAYLLSITLLAARSHATGKPPAHVDQYVAIVVTAIWLLHPLQLTSVLYVVQRMTSLSALFVLTGLTVYSRARLAHLQHGKQLLPALIATALLGGLATLSKENGILIFGYAIAIESTIFRFQCRSPSAKRAMTGFFALFIGLPALLLATALAFQPDVFLGGYAQRGFTLFERLLTEARILWFYLYLLASPSLSEMGLHHDDIVLSTGILTPLESLFALLGIIGVAIVSWRLRFRSPLLCLGVAWFLVGHSLESTFIPLEIAFEHRNYLPILGPILAVSVGAQRFFIRYSSAKTAAFAASGFIAIAATLTVLRADDWSHPHKHAMSELRHHPESPRANYEAGRTYAVMMQRSKSPEREIYFFKAREHFTASTNLSPSFSAGLFALIKLHHDADAETPPSIQRKLEYRLEISPFQATTVNWIRTLSDCMIREECTISESEMRRLFEAALRNQSIPPKAKSGVLAKLSEFEFRIAQNPEAAVQAAVASLSTARSRDKSHYALNLANLQAALGNMEYAKQLLDTVERDDQFGTHRSRIQEEREWIQSIAQPELK